jgi:hypothetical protein
VRLHQPPHRAALGDGAYHFYRDHRPHRLQVERLLGHDLFQPAILVLELSQPLDVAELQTAVLGRSSRS